MSASCTSPAEKLTPTEDLAEWQDSCGTDEHDSLTQYVTHGRTSTDSEMCSGVAKDDDTLVSCEFDCGPPMPRKNMINKGNARSTCWVCSACYCSMRAIIRSWSSRPDTKAMLDEIRSKDKYRWHALVRQCRIRASSEEVGLPNLQARKKAIIDSTQVIVQAFGVKDTADILWLTRSRFIAHHIYVEGIEGATLEEKEAAAAAKWTRDFANADIVRRGTGADTQLGVLGIPRTEGYRYRESARKVTCSDSVHSATDLSTTMHELSEHGTTAQALTGRAMGEFGAVFVQGAASSSSDTLPPSLPPRLVSAPPPNVICDPQVLEPQPGFSGLVVAGVKRRGLACSDSDTLKRAKGGVTGKVLELRNEALAAIKRACQMHGAARTNVANRWESLRLAGHVQLASAPLEMASWLATFNDTLAELKGPVKKDISNWTYLKREATC